MSVLTMDMSSYEVQRSDVVAERYGDEVLNSGWVPMLGLREAHCEHTELPPAMSFGNVDEFLSKMRCFQR
jgi:hypothetical protein